MRPVSRNKRLVGARQNAWCAEQSNPRVKEAEHLALREKPSIISDHADLVSFAQSVAVQTGQPHVAVTV